MPEWFPRVSRRAVLATGAVSIASIAGCSAFSAESPTLGLTLFNHDDSPYTVEMSVLRTGNDLSRSDARVFDASIHVDPAAEAQRANIAQVQRYLVRFELYEDNSRLTDEDHVHYYPDGGEEDEELTFDIHSPGVMTRR